MKRASLVAVSLLVAAIASAQSLAEIAEKEKKRREQTRAEGAPVKEFTGGGDAPGAAAENDPSSEPSSQPEDVKETDEKPEADSPHEPSDEWASIYAGYRERYRELQLEMRDFEAREQQWCSPPPVGTARSEWTSRAARYKENCRQARDDAAQLRAEIRQLESDCVTEAKRYGVQPGDARLGR